MGGFRLGLAGAAFDNGNRGVEALGRSVADVVDVAAPGSWLSVLDDGWGARPDRSGRYGSTTIEYVGARFSRRWYRPESWAQIRVAQAFGSRVNPVARRIATADAVLDLSGGDSFTDMYGRNRLEVVCAPKEATLRAARPLVLLPQTYGPFSTEAGRRRAEGLVRCATVAYARDAHSYECLVELAGPNADLSRLHRGVDVAFALEARRPPNEVADRIEALSGEVLAGVNVSGLLRGVKAQERFGLAGDYIATMSALVAELVATGAHVVLVPHVHGADGEGESDIAAIRDVLSRLGEQDRCRTTVVPPELDAAELKWCVARLAWFAGSRMHATIGALSSSVPAFGYAYSDKTHGVFETCGMEDYVADARHVAGADAVVTMLQSFDDRSKAQAILRQRAPVVIDQSREQLRDLLANVRDWRDDAARRVATR